MTHDQFDGLTPGQIAEAERHIEEQLAFFREQRARRTPDPDQPLHPLEWALVITLAAAAGAPTLVSVAGTPVEPAAPAVVAPGHNPATGKTAPTTDDAA